MNMNLSSDERLEILRMADNDRVWNAIDDERVCLHCKKIITGRQIAIRRDQSGRLQLHCPTRDCVSTVDDWFYLTHISLHSAQPQAAISLRREIDFANW
jgi:hypothetical protein